MRTIQKGSANPSVDVYIVDSSDGTPETGVVFNSSGIDLKFRREGATAVAITEIDLTTPALDDAHEDGGFLEIGNGVYRLDLPDAAVASGAAFVVVYGTVTGMIVLPVTVQLVGYDPMDAVRLGLTALPNAAADAGGGLPISDTGGLDLDAKLANTNEVTAVRMATLTDLINGGRLDTIFDSILTDTGTTLNTHLVDIKGTGFVKDTHSLIDIEGYVDLIDDGTSGLAKIATDVAAILTDTGTDGVKLATDSVNAAALATDAVNEIRDGIYQGTLTEGYASDGSAATLEQMLYMVWSALAEFAIAGTTITSKKLDGSTTAMTFTTDSSTVPTSRTRAT